MFLDVDGDGAFTSTDTWASPSGTVDLYMVTDHDEYGYPAACGDGTGIGIYSYTVNLFAHGDSVRITNVENMMPGMTVSTPLVTYPFALTVGYEGHQLFPPGTWHLLRMNVEFLGGYGCPTLSIVPSSCYSPAGVITSIESNCPGSAGDFILRYGPDFTAPFGFMCTDMGPHLPAITCPGEVHGREGQTLSFQVGITDPDCGADPFVYWQEGIPPGAVLSPLSGFQLGEATQDVTWTPTPGQAGVYTVTFIVDRSDWFNWYRRRQASTKLVIEPADFPPTAEAGGPYTGVQDSPITFDGSASSDPHGDALTYSWNFGDGIAGVGRTPQHAYTIGGLFQVILVVTDPGGMSDADTTTVSVVPALEVNVFPTPGVQVTRLTQGKPFICFQVEPGVGAAYGATDIILSSVRLHADACNGVEIEPTPAKRVEIRDTDQDGVAELQVCFSREAWAPLADCLTPGQHEISMRLHGLLVTGEAISGSFIHSFVTGAGGLAARITPNPLTVDSSIRFTTRAQGFVRCRLFDVQGRNVGVLLDEATLGPGDHEFPLMGLARIREGLASGIYFVRIDTQNDGSRTQSVTILR
jgi:hypothetical protein